MAWTAPATWTTGQLVGATDLNAQIRDNMTYLLSGRLGGTGSGTITTSSVTLVDVDATNCKVTFTPSGTVVMVLSMVQLGQIGTSGGSVSYDVAYDGTASGNLCTCGLSGGQGSVFNAATFFHIGLFTAVTAGVSHTFKGQAKVGSGTASALITAFIFVREIG